ncbi:hypothetical protein BDV93DRAFT_430981 [Ceratobasidium sp. AG-I]|nr:hypothetical protein BDV93DRAFT_430981 [Ceratobasidium sp. AG-I]
MEASSSSTPTAEKLIPRLYQQEIFHHAVKHNVICAMDTGSGKTQIAVMLLKHIMLQFPVDYVPKKASVAIFLVASVPLVEQQAEFLRSQLEHKVNKFYGAMGVDLWNRERWAQAFAESSVMVMTAQVFYDLLSHGHWHIKNVSLIIFDEAHHCNKKHVYAQIMKVHYFYCKPEERPRIFGMTASPIFNIRNPVMSLANLEEKMDAKVLAVRDNVIELALNAPRPNEFLAKYTPPQFEYPDYPTPHLWTLIDQYQSLLFANPDDVEDLHGRYNHVREELGPLCSDYFVLLFIQRALTKSTVSVAGLGAYFVDKNQVANGTENESKGLTWPKLDDAYKHHAQRIHDIASKLTEFQVDSWLTPKLHMLIQVLHAHFGPDFNAIIFVEQRQVATILAWLLPLIPALQGWLKAAALVGHGETGGATFEGSGMAHAAQRSIVQDFRSGATNLVIATAVAEEGLDFQACRLVVRLDAPQTMVGYLQSRGRARKRGSNFVVLADDAGAKRYVEFREAEPRLRLVYQRIIDDSKQEDDMMDVDKDDEDDDDRYEVPSTGAVVTPAAAVRLLHLWCSLLTVDQFTDPPAPDFKLAGHYICTITIPPSILKPSLCGPVEGPVRKTRNGARRAAAFVFVQKLHKLELFDDYLLPFRKSSTSPELFKSLNEPIRRQGEIFDALSPWGDVWRTGSSVWVNPISYSGSEPMIALITGKPQPERELNIFRNGASERVKIHATRRLEFDSEPERLSRLELMQRYSSCTIYWAISGRKMPARFACMVIPLTGESPDYEAMEQTEPQTQKLSKEEWLKPELVGSHVMRAHRLGSSSYKFVGIKNGIDLSSTPVIPEGQAKCQEAGHDTYQSYWEKETATAKRGVELDIPEDDYWLELISTEKAEFQSHGLFGLVDIVKPSPPAPKETRIFIPSHMARLSPISAEILKLCTLLPNILGQMIVLRRMGSVDDTLKTHGVPFRLMLEALTLPAVQAGFDYQRLETLGDSVLKVSTCTHIFLKYPGHHEGQLSAIKDSIVSNASLMVIGKRSPLAKFLITETMPTHRTWRPPASSVADETQEEPSDDETAQVTFHTKSLADCTESTLGATFLSVGIDGALRVGTALGLPIGGPMPWNLRKQPEFLEANGMALLFAPVEETLGYKFVNPSLVVEAFTHTAYDLSKGPSYNRLEFLGDSLVDLYVLRYMYLKFEKMTPGQMTWARSRLVNATTFGKLGVGLGLHKYMLTHSVALQKAMTSFATEVTDISFEEILVSCWKIDAPKAISDVFESIFGAIFVDSRFNLELTFGILDRVMSEIMKYISPDMPGDPTSELIRWVAAQGCEAQGTTIFSTGKSTAPHDTVETTLHGRLIARKTAATSKLARPMAAEETLAILKNNDHQYALSKICSCPRAVLKRMEANSDVMVEV